MTGGAAARIGRTSSSSADPGRWTLDTVLAQRYRIAGPIGRGGMGERAILRCLAPDPRYRPASAKAVAFALPGGDPLAAAIAAGETPSPEMVPTPRRPRVCGQPFSPASSRRLDCGS